MSLLSLFRLMFLALPLLFLLFPLLLLFPPSEASSCDIRTAGAADFVLAGCRGAAMEVNIGVAGCGASLVSASLYDKRRHRTYATFADLCQLEDEGIECAALDDCQTDSAWTCRPRSQERWACHQRLIFEYDWNERTYAYKRHRWKYGGHDECVLKAEVMFENGTRSKVDLCSEFSATDPGKYENFLPITGWVKTVYSSRRQQSSKHLLCVDYDLVEMRLDGNSAFSAAFEELDEALRVGSNRLRLTRRSRFENKNGGAWVVASLRTLKIRTINSTEEENDNENGTTIFLDPLHQFLSLSVAASVDPTRETLEAPTERLIMLTRQCGAVLSFDGAERRQDDALYATFSTSASISLSARSSPALDDGRWFVVVFDRPGDDDADVNDTLHVEVGVAEFESSDGLMFVVPVLVGVALLLLYRLLYTRLELHADVARVLGELATLSGVRVFGRVVVNVFAATTNSFVFHAVVFVVVFWIPGLQFVWSQYFRSRETGNRDLCFYNDACYYPSRWFPADIPFNAVTSTLPFLAHGLLLWLHLLTLETRCLTAGHAGFLDYNLGYAMSLALMAEGLFAATFHACPTRFVFQFDSACMILVASLVVVSVFHGWAVTDEDLRIRIIPEMGVESDGDEVVETIRGRVKDDDDTDDDFDRPPSSRRPIRAPKLFLFFLTPMLAFSYCGAVVDVEEADAAALFPDGFTRHLGLVRGVIAALFFAWLAGLTMWGMSKGRATWRGMLCGCFEEKRRGGDEDGDGGCRTFSWIFLAAAMLIATALALSFVFVILDFSMVFLGCSLGAAILALVLGEIRLASMRRLHKRRRSDGGGGGVRAFFMRDSSQFVLVLLYYFVFFAVWAAAFYFFAVVSRTKVTGTAKESRDLNRKCEFLGYYDAHDLWHLLSSHGLLLAVLRAITLGFPCRMCRLLFWDFEAESALDLRAISRVRRRALAKMGVTLPMGGVIRVRGAPRGAPRGGPPFKDVPMAYVGAAAASAAAVATSSTQTLTGAEMRAEKAPTTMKKKRRKKRVDSSSSSSSEDEKRFR